MTGWKRDDDEPVNLPREDLINFRALLAEIDDAGGLSRFKEALYLLNKPGVKDALEEMVAHHTAEKWRARFRADKEKMRARWWKLIAWFTGIAVALTAFISSLDSALTTLNDALSALRSWFRT